MGKAGKWIKNLLIGKKDKEKDGSNLYSSSGPTPTAPATPIAVTPGTPKEKRRWSFRRSPGTVDSTPVVQTIQEFENGQNEQKKHEMAATAVAVDAAMVAAAEVIKLTTTADEKQMGVEEASAIRIQSYFRSYLARKALCALKGLVKLQALVRGHLVRRQATATLRCMQALVTVQARARAQRIQMVEDGELTNKRSSIHRRSPQDNRFRQTYDELERGMEENVKIVEMDSGEAKGGLKSRHSYSNHQQIERVIDHRFSTYYPTRQHVHPNQDQAQISPLPSALTDMSPRTCSGHFEDYSFTTAQSSPQYYSSKSKIPFALPRPETSQDYQFYPNYMANTQSFKAKVRSQSAPKQRPDSYERQPSRCRASIEGRNVPRAVRMQRSSSHLGHQNPWSIKLDRSMVSLKDSECGSTSTVLTNATYCRSVATFDQIHGNRY